MRDDLAGLLERADLAVASCAGVVEEETLAPLIASVRAVRTRLAHPDDVLVVALAGGTGSGKSSLFNAFAGEELADVGGVRPTTSIPAAAVPVTTGAALDGYLDRMGIAERHEYDGPPICLLDLPDTDSVEVDHRHHVDRVLPLVDVVVWVTDPEKYRDARLHHDYLRPMHPYSEQLLFVLNQIDRLSAEQVDVVAGDLAKALREDGLEDTSIIPMAAAPPSGPPIGLAELGEALEDKRATRETLYSKLLTDLAGTARAMEGETGTGLDFDTRARKVVAQAAASLAAGDLDGAIGVLSGFLDRLATESGGVTTEKIEAITADVPGHLRRIESQLPETGRHKTRFWRRSTGVEPSVSAEAARDLLSDAVIRPVRAILARRAVAIASVAELAIEVERLRSARHR